jgi:hypothetical protein
MSSKVRLAVNQENLVKNLKFAFSNFSTFLAELIQNSRRAGATKVELTLDGKTLTVIDDGCGIEDFQNLFTIAESGWDSQTQSLESPFGMGFTSALFACKHLKVESRGKMLAERTQSVLSMSTLNVVDGTVTVGTKLTLAHLTFDENRIEAALKRIARGYAIPIFFNGEELERRDALDAKSFIQTTIGAIRINDLKSLRSERSMNVYLQGIAVIEAGYHSQKPSVIVHLDSTKFHAKLPDRDCLIDSEDKGTEIWKQILSVAHGLLAEQQRLLSPEGFVQEYWDAALAAAPDLIRNHPVAPGKLLDKLNDLVCCAEWHEAYEYYCRDRTPIYRDAFERGDIRIVRGSGYVDLDDDKDSAMQRAYVLRSDAMVLRGDVPAGHWLLNAPTFEDLGVRCDVKNPGEMAGSDYIGYEFEIQICDSLVLNGCWGEVMIDDMEISIARYDENGHMDMITVFSPAKTRSQGDGVMQFESFSGDDQLDEQYRDDCISRYRRWIKQARNVNPVDLLNDLLSDVQVDTSTAKSMRFVLEVSDRGWVKVVEKLGAIEKPVTAEA